MSNFTTTNTILPFFKNPPKQIGVKLYTSGVKYAAAIHEGRKPGSSGPPADALKEWCRRVLGDEGLAFAVAKMIHRWGFSEAHHGGQTAAKYATKPLHEHAREWSKETVHAIQRGASPKEALGRVATQWEGDADAIVSEHWTWRGTLKQRIHSKVEIVK